MTTILKSLSDIRNSPWCSNSTDLTGYKSSEIVWDYDNPINLEDVNLWEELYFQMGNVGIYAAYDPYVEFYIIVYNLFANLECGIEKFYGFGANKQVWERAKKLGIDLPVETVWVSKKEFPLYESLSNST